MGYLINPIAMRIGHTYYWEDLLYKGQLYYPEFIHKIFKIKSLINLYFSSEFFSLSKIWFNYCDIISQNKSLLIKVYLYDSNLQRILNTYNKDNLISLKENYLDKINKSDFKLFISLNFFFQINKTLISFLYLAKPLEHALKNTRVLKVLWLSLSKITILKNLILFLIKYKILIPFYRRIKAHILNILRSLFINYNLNLLVYSSSNENLSAKFLAKFIAVKLQQGEYLKNIINSIKNDLLRGNVKINTKFSKNYKSTYKILFFNVKKNIIKITLNKMRLLMTWFTVNGFDFVKKAKNFSKNNLIKLFKNYWNLYVYFVYYFLIFFQNSGNRYYESLLKSTECNFSNYNFGNSFLNQSLTQLVFFFQKLIKLQYLMTIASYSKKVPNENQFPLLGFKFHLLGRFSRVQRASSIWYQEGKVPLNTIHANIEFSNFVIPLFNSAINVKVYLNRNSKFRIKKTLII